MKVSRAQLDAMFVELGSKVAPQWNEGRMQTKLKALPKTLKEEGVDTSKLKCNDLLEKVLKAIEAGKDIEITSEDAAEETTSTKKGKEKPAKESKKKGKEEKEEEEEEAPKKKGKKNKDEEEEEEEEDEEEEEEEDEEEEDEDEEEEAPKKKRKKGKKGKKDDDDDEEAPKKKKKKKKKGKGEKIPRVGVISKIVELIQGASKKEPISKKSILKSLSKAFPERDAEGMMKTINIQVPSRLNKEKELGIVKKDDGYYIPKK